VSRKIKTSF